MKSNYPFVLVHGIALKDFKFFKCFGRIEKMLAQEGYVVCTGETDGFGTIESNAAQLKEHVGRILAKTGAEKVNLIAHSKGGLDSKYMIEQLGMEDKVASLTTLCTPHKGAALASAILRLPAFIPKFLNFWINLFYRLFGDKHPDALTVCKQLQATPHIETSTLQFSDKVYCQSYSSVMEKSRADFVTDIPLMVFKRLEKEPSDGLVSVESAKFGNYRGNCMEESLSHTEIIGFTTRKKKKEKIFDFYRRLCEELCAMGF